MDITDIYTARTLDSGIQSIVLKFRPMYDCYYGRVVGYRGRAYINSILYGTLDPSEYLPALDAEEQTGLSLVGYGLKHILADLGGSDDLAGIRFVTFECPPCVLFCEELRKTLVQAAGKQDASLCERVLLEFGDEVLGYDEDQIARAFSDICAAGFGVAIRNYGSRFFPMAQLIRLTPDAVFLGGETVALLADREKSAVVPSFVRFAKSLDVQVIAECVPNDVQLRELNSAECVAFLPSEEYHGTYTAVCAEKQLGEWLTERRENFRGGTE